MAWLLTIFCRWRRFRSMETIFWLNETCMRPKKNSKKCLVKGKNRLHRPKSSPGAQVFGSAVWFNACSISISQAKVSCRTLIRYPDILILRNYGWGPWRRFQSMETIFWLNKTCMRPKKNSKKCLVKRKNRLHRPKSSPPLQCRPVITDTPADDYTYFFSLYTYNKYTYIQ
jgi:hypothetical protein